MPTKKNEEKSHISPDRIHRFMDDDEAVAHQEVIPGPSKPSPVTGKKKEK